MIAFQQIILLKKYEVKMHQRFCKPDKKYTPASPPKKNPVPKKEWAPAVSEVQELFISKVQKQIIKLTSHSLSLEKKFYTRWTIYPKVSLLGKDCIQAWKVLSPT